MKKILALLIIGSVFGVGCGQAKPVVEERPATTSDAVVVSPEVTNQNQKADEKPNVPMNEPPVMPDGYSVPLPDEPKISATFESLGRLPQRPDTTRKLAFSPDGKWLACGGTGKDCSIYLCEVNSGRTVHVLSGAAESIRGVAFTPNGRFLVSGSYDGSVVEWDVETGKRTRTLIEQRLFGGIGVRFKQMPENDGFVVQEILPNLAAAKDGRLRPGDRALAVVAGDG